MAKYDPLTEHLRRAEPTALVMTFDQVAAIVEGLPPSARTTRNWWGNTVNPRQVHAAAWIAAGWVVQSVDVRHGTVTFAPGTPDTRPQGKRGTQAPDGVEQLAIVLRRAGYRSTMHAVAAHALMLAPSVVAETGGQAVFSTVRRDGLAREPIGRLGELSGRPVMFDDNLSPIAAFTWAAGFGRGRDMQFNHIWPSSRDASAYTALWNLCATPAFLAKTTDGRNHPDVVAALRRRSFELYGYLPAGASVPVAPEGYGELEWADHPAPTSRLETMYRTQMSTKPKDRVVVSAREIGWLFSGWLPDNSL
ncbi:MAG: hypothetical protein ABMA25_24190 [Ilumatobacteraceae bacterium]